MTIYHMHIHTGEDLFRFLSKETISHTIPQMNKKENYRKEFRNFVGVWLLYAFARKK